MKRLLVSSIILTVLLPIYSLSLSTSFTMGGGYTASHFQTDDPLFRSHGIVTWEARPLAIEEGGFRTGPVFRLSYISPSLSYQGQYYLDISTVGTGLFLSYQMKSIETELYGGLSWGYIFSSGYKTMLLDAAITMKFFPGNHVIPLITTALSVREGVCYLSLIAAIEMRFDWWRDEK